MTDKAHTYVTSVYALDAILETPPEAITREKFEKEFAANILAVATTRGKF